MTIDNFIKEIDKKEKPIQMFIDLSTFEVNSQMCHNLIHNYLYSFITENSTSLTKNELQIPFK